MPCTQKSHEEALLSPLQLVGAERGPGGFSRTPTGWHLKGLSMQRPGRSGKHWEICERAVWSAECANCVYGCVSVWGRLHLFSVWHTSVEVFQTEGIARDRRRGLPHPLAEKSHKQVGCHKAAQRHASTEHRADLGPARVPEKTPRSPKQAAGCKGVCVRGVRIPEIGVSMDRVWKVDF